MQFVSYQDGHFLSEVLLPPTTLGFTRGYAAFELLRTYNFIPFCLQEHLTRLKNSAKTLQIHYPEGLDDIVYSLIEQNPYPNILIRLYLSEDEASNKPHILALAGPLSIPTKEQYTYGIPIITTSLQRQFPLVKSTSYLPALLALKEASQKKAEDALFLSPSHHLLELTKSNFFAVFDNTLYTAPEGILLGITRSVVIKLAKELAIPFKEAPLPYTSLPHLSEAFSTSTTREILPISQIDSTKIPLGPITKHLHNAFSSCIIEPLSVK